MISNIGVVKPQRYLRFETTNLHPVSGKREGIFCPAYEFRHETDLLPYQHEQLEELLSWFRKNLKIPDRFNSSKSKGSHRRNATGLSWFKDSSKDCILKVRELEALLNDLGVVIKCTSTTRPGYIVYEDENQIVAEPFSDLR